MAKQDRQFIIGQYNQHEYEPDSDPKHVFVVGWGWNNESRRNIHTIDRSGNAYYAGTITAKGGAVATSSEVTQQIREELRLLDLPSSYLSVKQTQQLTTEQQTVARQNIDAEQAGLAMTAEEINTIWNEVMG